MTSANPYSEAQAAKAIAALKAHLSTVKPGSKPSLFDNEEGEYSSDSEPTQAADPDQAFWLVLTTKKYQATQKKTKAIRIPLPHPYLPSLPTATFTICLIIKDSPTTTKYIKSTLLPSLPLPPASLTIISPAKLKTHYKSYESRRQLERAHDVFLADDRVITLLPGLLGKSVYSRSAKVPIPVKLSTLDVASDGTTVGKAKLAKDGEKLLEVIEKAVSASYVIPAATPTQTIKVGTRAQKTEDVAGNISAVLEFYTKEVVKGGWQGVRSVFVKAAETVALPVWMAEKVYDDEDVLGEDEVKRIEYLKTKEGREERRKELKEKKNGRKKEREERRQKVRRWDSDVESGEEQEFVRRPRGLLENGDKAEVGKKRKAEVEGEASAKKARVEKEVAPPPAAAVVEEEDDDEDIDEEGGVKLPEPVDLSAQAKKLKIGDKRIAPPAPAIKEKSKKDKSKGGDKDGLKRKASKPDLAAKGKKKKAKA